METCNIQDINGCIAFISKNYLSKDSIEWLILFFKLIGGGTLFSLIFWFLNRVFRKKWAAEAKNTELTRSIESKNHLIDLYKKDLLENDALISKKNAEIELYKSFFPNDEEISHALFHELVDLTGKSKNIKDLGLKYFESSDHVYFGAPLSRQFLENSVSLLARARHVTIKNRSCARHHVARHFQNRYLRAAWIGTQSGKRPIILGMIDRNTVGADIQEIDFLLELCRKFEGIDEYDIFLSAKIAIGMLSDQLIDPEDRQKCFSTSRDDARRMLEIANLDKAKELKEVLPNSFSCGALSKMKSGMSRFDAGLDEKTILALCESPKIHGELYRILYYEAKGQDTRNKYEWS